MSSSKLLLISDGPLLHVGSGPGQGADGGMCFEILLWPWECCCAWALERPQKEEAPASGGEGPLTSDSRSSLLSRP